MNRAILLVNVVAVLIGISYGMHGPILPVFAKNVIGASYTELGIIGLAAFVPYMFIPIFVGMLLGRYNNGHLLSIGVAVNAASIYLLSVSQHVAEIAMFRVMTGVAHAFFWPSCESIIARSSGDRKIIPEIAKFSGLFIAGFTMGPLLGSFLLESGDVTYRFIFQIASFILAAAIVASLSLSRERVRGHRSRFSLSTVREMAKFPEIMIMLIYCTASFGIILTIYPAFLDDHSISGTEIELLYFLFGISRVITLILTGRLARRPAPTLIAVILSISAGLAISFAADSAEWFAVALLFMGFGFSVLFPITLGIIMNRTKRESAGSLIGAYETIFGIGWVIGPITAGVISQFHGNTAPYVVFFALGIVIAAVSAARRRALELRE